MIMNKLLTQINVFNQGADIVSMCWTISLSFQIGVYFMLKYAQKRWFSPLRALFYTNVDHLTYYPHYH